MRLASFCFLLFVLAGISAAQDMNFAVGPQYLMTSGSPMFARPIATPTLSLDAPLPSLPSLPEVGPPVADQPFVPNPEIQGPDLLPVYYGYPMPSVVELTSTEAASEVPQSIINAGVVGMTNVQSLRERGYGVTLGESALFWKSHKLHASRLYTNTDVERLHGG
ncbi:MAG TPA: hypothetical protein VNX60_11065 [Candidatus Acidoferrum sp.]|nr:hypothetical protein [Candidatus Acidoferrum sp.]